ncbi:unnamed protein product [Caenorhabditis brenneri]
MFIAMMGSAEHTLNRHDVVGTCSVWSSLEYIFQTGNWTMSGILVCNTWFAVIHGVVIHRTSQLRNPKLLQGMLV